MTRIALTDGSNGWFNSETAKAFKEGTRWDGNNHISLATGSQWDHECIYRTAGGKWILNHWSQYQGSQETYEEIDTAQAASWLVANGRDDELDELTKDVRQEIEEQLALTEL